MGISASPAFTTLSAADVRSQVAVALGLPETAATDLTAPRSLAALLRRAAGLLCPCPPSTLVRAVQDGLEGIIPYDAPSDQDRLRERLSGAVEAMAAYGDLLEIPADAGQAHQRGTWLAAAPPRFVVRHSGSVYLMGVAPDNVPILPHDIESRIDHRGHVRRLAQLGAENLPGVLRRAGLVEWREQEWLYAPPKQTAVGLLADLDARLSQAGPAGDVEDLDVLDPSMPADFYVKRWRKAVRQTGRFVAKRPRSYGSALWCYVELQNGRPVRLLDFPSPLARWRGCDEAFQVQAAVDATRGTPQFFTATPETVDATLIRFFCPLPEWALRRLDTFGSPRGRSAGGLFAYSLPAAEAAQEMEFLRSRLWMKPKE